MESMKRLLLLLVFFLPLSVSATTTVSGTLQNLGTGTVGTGAFIRFWLRGCGGNQPRVNGTALIAPSQGSVFFFDLIANSSGVISGTLYSTRDSTGLLAGDIECGGSKLSVWLGMQVFVAGKGGPEIPVHTKNGVTLDITSVTPISTTPVVTAPSGDSTYLRIDGANSPVICTFQGILTPVTGNSSDLPYYTCTIPANVIAAGKGIRITALVQHTSGAGNITYRLSFGGTLTTAITETNPTRDKLVYEIFNSQGVQNVQTIASAVLDSNSGTTTVRTDSAAINAQNAIIVTATFNVANSDQVTPQMFWGERIP